MYSSTIFGQGFYDNNRVLISKANLAKLNITSVTSTTLYADSSFHPLSNFVFEDRFNNTGDIIFKKYWGWQLNNSNRVMKVILMIDSGYYDERIGKIHLINIAQSKIVNFKQDKARNEKYIRNTFDKFKVIHNYKNQDFPRFSGREEFLVDTILLKKHISIPEGLLPRGDSISQSSDTIKIYSKTPTSCFLS
jgi:hypothetical protein